MGNADDVKSDEEIILEGNNVEWAAWEFNNTEEIDTKDEEEKNDIRKAKEMWYEKVKIFINYVNAVS